MTTDIIEANRKIFQRVEANQLVAEIKSEDEARSSRIVEENNSCPQTIVKQLFQYRLSDELDQITQADEVTREFINNRCTLSKIYKPKI